MRITLLAAGIALILAHCAIATERVDLPMTVLLKSGEAITGQSYAIDNGLKVFGLFTVDGLKKFSFTDIEAIHNKDGENVAAALMEGYYTPRSGKRQPTASIAFKKSQQRPWSTRIGFEGNLNIPAGGYYEGISFGNGIGGNIVMGLTRELGLRLMVTRLGMNVDQDAFPLESRDPAFSIVSQNFSVRAIRFMLAIEYYHEVNNNRPGSKYFIAYSGLGAISHSFRLDMTLREKGTGMIFLESGKSSESKFALNTGVGYMSLLSNLIGFEGSISLDYVFSEGTNANGIPSAGVHGIILSLNLGIVFVFGSKFTSIGVTH